MLSSIRKKYIGDKTFYQMVLSIMVPIIIQNIITSFVSLLDNIMVGQMGTEQMSGVSIANQLMFVYYLCIFGGYSGAGIFTAQFHGKGDPDGIRYTMRFKALLGLGLSIAALLVFTCLSGPLISLFLHDGSQTGNLAVTLDVGQKYLYVMLFGLLPFAAAQVYTGTLREVGETMLPMKAGVTAVLVNLIFNWLLIYGNLGFPRLGVQGAAIATVLSRFVECGIVVVWSHRHKARFPFIEKVWNTIRLPWTLAKDIIRRGMPLLVNEALWSFSITAINQCYSTRGLAVVAGMNIASTIVNLFNVVYMATGNSVGIVVGRLLGKGEMRQAVDTDRKMIFFGAAVAAAVGWIMCLLSGLFPRLYNTTDEVRQTAAYMITVAGLLMPFNAVLHCCYFTLRCGGKTVLTFLYDCMFVFAVNLPLAYALTAFTDLDIILIYPICQSVDIIKAILGIILVKKGIWINNIVGVPEKTAE